MTRPRALPWVLVGLLAAVGVARIVTAGRALNQVYDEPAHLASGIEYYQTGGYRLTPDHAPLPRAAVGLGPYLAGCRLTGNRDAFEGRADAFEEGTAILHQGDYGRNLALARLGILPFFVLAAVLVWLWTRRLFGVTAGIAATFLFTSLPPILAHAGFATTDMAFTAGLLAAVYGLTRWIEHPAWRSAVGLGLGLALAVATKYSVLLFLPICAVVTLLLSHAAGAFAHDDRRRRMLTLAGALAVAFLCVWAAYRFSFGPVWPGGIPVPAPEWLRGILATRAHVRTGHPSYLFGNVRLNGWWYFFPVVLAVKTPLAFLALLGAGVAVLLRGSRETAARRQWIPLYCATALLVACLPSTINLGVRHVLPLYSFLAVVAGAGAAALLQSSRRTALAAGAALLCWHVVSSAAAHPDYLSYFNELAGRHPENVLAESDIDWGQDVKRLSAAARALHIPELSIAYFGSADLNRHGLPPWKPLPVYQPVTGWVAISVQQLMMTSRVAQLVTHRSERGYQWLEAHQPVARAGKSIWIYYIPPPR